MRDFFLKNRYLISLFFLVLLCLWELSGFLYISKWDNIDAYLPSRYLISDYLWNGKFPFWNSFQNLGTPIYSDFQSGIWYPVTWVLMLFGKYTIWSLTIEILSCYIIAAFGFYKLGLFFYNNKKVAFILALSYGLSGFMVGSSQILPFLIGIAWLPWIIYGLLTFLKTLQYKYAVLTGVFIAFCTTGGSPPFIIVLVYIFIGVYLYNFFKYRLERDRIKSILYGGVITVGISFVLLLPFLISVIDFLPYLNRGGKLPYEQLTYNNFTFQEYISFLFPFSVLSSSELFNNTDVTLRSSYFGIIGFVYLVISLFTIKNKYLIPLVVSAIVSLLLAAGSSTFFYLLAYELPGFGVFKHSSFFKVYFILCCLLLAGFSISKDLRGELSVKLKKRVLIVFIGTALLVLSMSAFLMNDGEAGDVLSKVLSFEEKFEAGLWSHLFINSIVVSVLLSFFYFFKSSNKLFTGLVIVIVADLFVQTQLSAPKSVFNKIEYTQVSAFFEKLPNEINQKIALVPLNKTGENQKLIKIDGFWRNVETFNKVIDYKGYNPMRFKGYEKGEANGVLSKMIEKPILSFMLDESTETNSVLIDYNLFSAEVKNKSNADKLFLLNQNYHDNWIAKIDGNVIEIQLIEELIMGVKIPANSSGKVTFEYSSPLIMPTLGISLIIYFLLILYFIRDYRKCSKECEIS
jgi:hypothetical protein